MLTRRPHPPSSESCQQGCWRRRGAKQTGEREERAKREEKGGRASPGLEPQHGYLAAAVSPAERAVETPERALVRVPNS